MNTLEDPKETISIGQFTARLRSQIDPTEFVRAILLDQEDDPRGDPDRDCQLEYQDRTAFRQVVNDTMDSLEKARELVTFDNGHRYYHVYEVKDTIAHLDLDNSTLDDDLKGVIDFWL